MPIRVSSLLEFSRTRPFTIEAVNLAKTARAVMPLVENEAKINGVGIAVTIEEQTPPVRASAFELQQIFINLIVNSIQAMPSGGTITISVEPAGQDNVAVIIKDTGQGIEPAISEKVFEPFFTTKPPGKGTGLGLAICRRIAGQFGGSLSLASPGKGQGTTAVLTLIKAG